MTFVPYNLCGVEASYVVTHGRSYIVILVCFGMDLAHFTDAI
jgi:hypothetical protein